MSKIKLRLIDSQKRKSFDLIEHCRFPSLLATVFQKKIIFQPVDTTQSESLLVLNLFRIEVDEELHL